MNNNDLFKRLHNETNNISPSDKLNPENIEDMLSGVKRSNHKKYINACVALILCVCIGALVKIAVQSPAPVKIKSTKNNSVTASQAKNYKEIYNIVSENINNVFIYYGKIETDSEYIKEESTGTNSFSTDEYSSTNVQVEGIDEADAVKTDGKYIYSISQSDIGSNINIYNPNNGKPELISSINTVHDFNEFYVQNNKVITMYCTEFGGFKDTTPDESQLELTDDCNIYQITKICIYNLSDITKPVLESELIQSGNYISSRLKDGILYTITEQTIDSSNEISLKNPVTYCPFYSSYGKLNCVKPESITLDKNAVNAGYVTVTSIDLNINSEFSDVNSVLGGGSEVYMSQNNIYISSYSCTSQDNLYEVINNYKTEILRFSVEGTDINTNCGFSIEGELFNQFSMDERNNYFRVVYQKYRDNDNSVFVAIFDKDTNLTGEIEIPVGNEEIKSVRFDEDTAYFVTFENTDPLFAADLSDPKKPELLSELKITGYSAYLHPMNDNSLLGFGPEIDEKSNDRLGLKISVFDVSDKNNIKVTANLLFAKTVKNNKYEYYSSSEAEDNHKAIYVDKYNNIIGIPYSTVKTVYHSDGSWNVKGYEYYALFRYDDSTNNLKIIKNIKLKEEKSYDSYSRGLLIGNYFYVVTNKTIDAFEYNSFTNTSKNFSYEYDLNQIKKNDTGVKSDGFKNNKKQKIINYYDAIQIASNEVNIPYDSVKVYYDNKKKIWKVHFSKDKKLGGDQCVYLNNDGITLYCVYGE